MSNKYKKPPFFLGLFIRLYVFFASLGARSLPKFKGLFYYIYSRIKNKRGVVLIPTIDGNRLYIDLADNIVSTKIIQYGYWEKGLTDLVRKIVKPGMNIIDIGGHVGYYSVLFSKLSSPGGRVFVFEPEPHNFGLLRENILVNNITNCESVNSAVSDFNGKIELYLDSDNLGAHSVIDHGKSRGGVKVDAIKIDDSLLIKDKKIDFIKIDIEGYEYAFFDGAKEILKRNKDIVIVMEFCPSLIEKAGKTPGSLLDKISSLGFHIYIIDHYDGTLKEISKNNRLEDLGNFGLFNLLCSRNKIKF